MVEPVVEIYPQVVTFGDNCLNIIFRIAAPLNRGANFEMSEVIRRPGGNALVTALALSAWGIRTAYSGVIGNDDEGQILRSWMQCAGVDYSGVIWRNLSRKSYVILDPADRTILDMREKSMKAELQVEDWHENPILEQMARHAEVILVDKYCSAIHEKIITLVKETRSIINHPLLLYRTGSRSSAGLAVESRIFPEADIVLTKRRFLQEITGENSPLAACQELSNHFRICVVVTTLGSEGAAFYDARSDSGAVVSAGSIRTATTLGAGDFFRAGFILGLLRKQSLIEACQMGNLAAARHCEQGESDDPSVLFSKEV